MGPRSSKESVQLFFLCPFYQKPRPSRVSLVFPGLENIPQVAGNRPNNNNNNNNNNLLVFPYRWCYLNAVSRTFSVLNDVGLYLGLEAPSRAFNYFSSVHFTENQDYHELLQSPRNWKISPKFPEIDSNLVNITLRVRRSGLLFQS